MSLPPVPASQDTLQFLERCHALGAAGVQTKITGDPKQLRARAEDLGMWIEAMISVRHTTPETLEHEILQAKAAGCTLARDGLLGGRRYETFPSLADWNNWKTASLTKLKQAIPIFEKHQFTLALENHKDWTLDEYLGLFHAHPSEYFGACLDFGNNLSLLDDVMNTFHAVLPYLKATHCKDIAVAPCPAGFLLSEVPLGEGILDLPAMFRVLGDHHPRVHLALEMITRDPLLVPCLTDHYWTTFPERSGLSLARTLRFVNRNACATELSEPENLTAAQHLQLEEKNIQACFAYAQRGLRNKPGSAADS